MLVPKRNIEATGRSKFLDSDKARVGVLYYSTAFNWASSLEGLDRKSFEKLLQISQTTIYEEICDCFGFEPFELKNVIDLSRYGKHFAPAQIAIIIQEFMESIFKTIFGNCSISPISLENVTINVTFCFSSLEEAEDFFNTI